VIGDWGLGIRDQASVIGECGLRNADLRFAIRYLLI